MYQLKTDQERHDYILKTFVLNKAANTESQRHKRDIDVIKENHRFLWEDNETPQFDSWEERLARKYYDKLFKEYCIADLTRHKENKVALRWRTEGEVVAGTGQFICGSRKCIHRVEDGGLRTWEVNFAYQEQGERKNALVKLRLCPEHSAQLNYTSQKREVKRLKRNERQQAKMLKRRQRKETKEQRKETESTPNVFERDDKDNDANVSALEKEATATEELDVAMDSMAVQSSTCDDVWNKQVELETELNTRENDFERYLEDLLL